MQHLDAVTKTYKGWRDANGAELEFDLSTGQVRLGDVVYATYKQGRWQSDHATVMQEDDEDPQRFIIRYEPAPGVNKSHLAFWFTDNKGKLMQIDEQSAAKPAPYPWEGYAGGFRYYNDVRSSAESTSTVSTEQYDDAGLGAGFGAGLGAGLGESESASTYDDLRL
jgi:hypothetical protein